MNTPIEHTRSSGNVFADLGLENADELHLKSSLTMLIHFLNKLNYRVTITVADGSDSPGAVIEQFVSQPSHKTP